MFVREIATSFESVTGRSRAVLSAARSLLLLEYDADIDWEVDQERAAVTPHPHRGRLGAASRHRARRPGQPPAAEQVCLSPLRGGPGPDRPAPVVVRRLDAHRHAPSRATPTCVAPER